MTRKQMARWVRKGTHRVGTARKYRMLAREAEREMKEQGR